VGVAKGGVRVAEADGAAGVTSTAQLAGAEHHAWGEEPVDIVGEGYRIRAEHGFALDFSSPGNLELKGPIDTTVGGVLR
jgi:hypothetical protein